VSAFAQDPAPDGLARGETDAGTEAAADDQDQHRAQRAGDRVVDADVVEQRTRGRRAQQHTNDKAHVLRKRQPEASTVTVDQAHHGGGQDHEIDEVWIQIFKVTAAPLRATR